MLDLYLLITKFLTLPSPLPLEIQVLGFIKTTSGTVEKLIIIHLHSWFMDHLNYSKAGRKATFFKVLNTCQFITKRKGKEERAVGNQ